MHRVFSVRARAGKWMTTACAVAAAGAGCWHLSLSSSSQRSKALAASKSTDAKSSKPVEAAVVEVKKTDTVTAAVSTAPKSSPPRATPVGTAPSAPLDESKLRLRQVTVVMRHGARTPIDILPGETKEQFDAVWNGQCGSTDPNGASTPCQLGGELTRHGRLQAIEVGRYLRQRYITGEEADAGTKPAAATVAAPPSADSARDDADEYEPIDAAAVPILKNPPPPPPIATPSSVGFFPPQFSAAPAAAATAAVSGDPFFYLRATTVPRTQLTLAGVFQGLYPEQYPNEATANAFIKANTEIRTHRHTGDDPKSSHNVRDESMLQAATCAAASHPALQH